ncbi:MAG: GatB/YqeY domain-containing protein [bacterium]|nr:GatB/YqeY domain-containing protein [bacterium]
MTSNTLQEKIKDALKAGDAVRVSTLRLLLSALNNEKIAKMRDLTEDEELAVIKRQLKQREEAFIAYENAGRTESAEKEKQEAQILQEFLPEQMGEEEISGLVDKFISELDNRDFGAVMKAVMEQVKGKADGKLVSDIVRKKLHA